MTADRAQAAETHLRGERPEGPLSWLGLGVVAATIAADQAAKAAAEAALPLGEPVDVLPILALYRIHNPGIAFSMLSRLGGAGLVAMTLAIVIVVLVFWWRASDGGRIAAFGYALIVGGALGNLADRLIYGEVVDFLLLHFGGWTLFVFNLADAALTLGPALLLFTYMRARSQSGVAG